jgi:hypothetical protein
MGIDDKLQIASQNALEEIERILREGAATYPYLAGSARAMRRMAKAARRPMRLAILGAPGSGKSALGNLLAGEIVLPAPSLPHASAPVLLKYASQPSFAAVYGNGDIVDLSSDRPPAQAVTAILNCSAMSSLFAGRCVQSGGLKYLEIGLPSATFRAIEILDLPADYAGFAGLGVDAVIWTAVASRVSRAAVQFQWAKLPRTVRYRSLLAVTYCDLVENGNDLKWLRTKLELAAKPAFQGVCLVANGDLDLAAAAVRNKALFIQVQALAQQFATERFGRAMAVAQRALIGPALKTEAGLENDGLRILSTMRAREEFPASPPRSLDALEKPSILLNGHMYAALMYNAPAKIAASAGAANHSEPAPARSRMPAPRWVASGAAAAAMAAMVALAAMQPGLFSVAGWNAGARHALNASAPSEQPPADMLEWSRSAEAEGAAAIKRGMSHAETAALEERAAFGPQTAAVEERANFPAGNLAAEENRAVTARAVAAHENRLVHGAAEPKKLKAEETGGGRRRAVAEAALHKTSGTLIMHGVSQ